MGAQVTAFLCGVLAIASVFQLAKSAPYLGGAGLFAGVVTGTIAALLARADVSLRIAIRLVCLAGAGVAAALIFYIVAINVYSPGAQSALPDIQPLGDSAHDVRALGTASFTVTVPPHYHQLTISFTVANSDPVNKSDNCVNGSQEDITAASGAWLAVRDIPTGRTGTLQIPPGVSGFTLAVQFQPQLTYTVCLEDIQVAYAQFSN